MNNAMRILDVVDMSNGFMMPDGSLHVQDAETIVESTNAFFKSIPQRGFNFALVKNDTHFKAEYYLSDEAAYGFPFHQGFGTYDHQYAVDTSLLENKMAVYWMLKNEFDMWAGKKDIGLDINDMNFASVAERRAYQYLFHIARKRADGYSYLLPRDSFFNSIVADRKVAVVIGVAEDYCVRDAIKGYLARGFEVVLLKDLTKGIYDTSIPGGVANWGELVEAHFADAVKSGQLKATTSANYLETL